MADPEPLTPLLGALRAVCEWLQTSQAPHVLIGGVAVSLLSRPRFTRDVDALALLDEARWQELLAAGVAFGLVPRLDDALAFARQARVLLLRHDPSGIDIDVSFGLLPFEEEAIRRSVVVELAGTAVPVPRAEDLIVMKAVAGRPRDLQDIEALLDVHPGVDRDYVRGWVAGFAEALDAPEMLRELEAALARR